MTQSWRIHCAQEYDSEDLARVHATSFPHDEAWSASDFRLLLKTPGCRAFAASSPAIKWLGLCMTRQAADEAEILTLAVAPPYRRLRVARELLRHASTSLQQDGVRKIFLEVREDNRAARLLYTNAGYKTCGTRENYYDDGSTALLMRLDLS